MKILLKNNRLGLVAIALVILGLVVGFGTLILFLLLPIIGLWTLPIFLGYVLAVGYGMWKGAQDKEEDI